VLGLHCAEEVVALRNENFLPFRAAQSERSERMRPDLGG